MQISDHFGAIDLIQHLVAAGRIDLHLQGLELDRIGRSEERSRGERHGGEKPLQVHAVQSPSI